MRLLLQDQNPSVAYGIKPVKTSKLKEERAKLLEQLTELAHSKNHSQISGIGLGKLGDSGDEEETPKHLLCECVAVSNIRTNLFSSSIINDEEISSLKPTQLLACIKACEAGGGTVMKLASAAHILVTGGKIGRNALSLQ